METVIESVNEQRKENASVTSSTCKEILNGQEEVKRLIKMMVEEQQEQQQEQQVNIVEGSSG